MFEPWCAIFKTRTVVGHDESVSKQYLVSCVARLMSANSFYSFVSFYFAERSKSPFPKTVKVCMACLAGNGFVECFEVDAFRLFFKFLFSLYFTFPVRFLAVSS